MTDSPGTSSEPSARSSARTPLRSAFAAKPAAVARSSVAGGAQERAAADHRDAEGLEHLVAELGGAEYQAGLELPWRGIEAGVEDAGVGAACCQAGRGLGLEHRHGGAAAGQSASATAAPITPAPTTAISASTRRP